MPKLGGRDLSVADIIQINEKVVPGIKPLENQLFEATIISHTKHDHCAVIANHSSHKLCHERHGHASETTIRKRIPMMSGVSLNRNHYNEVCETCQLTNARRLSRPPRCTELKAASKCSI